MIDKLAKVCVKRWYPALLVVLPILRGIEAVRHLGAQLAEVLVIRVIVDAKSSGA